MVFSTNNPKVLINTIKSFLLCIHTDAARGALQGVLVDYVSEKDEQVDARLVATDGVIMLLRNISAPRNTWIAAGFNSTILKTGNVFKKGLAGYVLIEEPYPDWRKAVPHRFTNEGNAPLFLLDTVSRLIPILKLLGLGKKVIEHRVARPAYWNSAISATIWNAGIGGYLLCMPARDTHQGEIRKGIESFDIEGGQEINVEWEAMK